MATVREIIENLARYHDWDDELQVIGEREFLGRGAVRDAHKVVKTGGGLPAHISYIIVPDIEPPPGVVLHTYQGCVEAVFGSDNTPIPFVTHEIHKG